MAGHAFNVVVGSSVLVGGKFGTHHAVARRSTELIAFHVVNGLIAECSAKNDVDNRNGADEEQELFRRFALPGKGNSLSIFWTLTTIHGDAGGNQREAREESYREKNELEDAGISGACSAKAQHPQPKHRGAGDQNNADAAKPVIGKKEDGYNSRNPCSLLRPICLIGHRMLLHCLVL